MTTQENEDYLASALRDDAASLSPPAHDSLAARFAARLREVAAHPERVPIRIDGVPLEARAGGTVLAAALKNQVRLMHICGARKLCGTCRVKIDEGGENLSPMSFKEKLSLRGHLSLSPRTRLACQARVNGPVELESVFPLCGDLPGD